MDGQIQSGQPNPDFELPTGVGAEPDTRGTASTAGTKGAAPTQPVTSTGILQPGQSVIEKSTTPPSSNLKGYPAKSGNPALPAPTSFDATKAANILTDIPTMFAKLQQPMMHIHLATQQMQAQGTIPGSLADKQAKEDAEANYGDESSDSDLQGMQQNVSGDVSPKDVKAMIMQAVQSTLTPTQLKSLQQSLENNSSSGQDPKLQNVLNTVITQVLTQLKNKIQPPLSPSEQANLNNFVSQFLANPTGPFSPPIPNSVINVLCSIVSTVNAAVETQFEAASNIDTASSGAASNVGKVSALDPAMKQILDNAVGNVKEMESRAKSLAESLPPGPEKNVFMNYLKLIGQALAKITEEMYTVEANQGNTAKTLANLKMNMQLDALHAQAAAEKAAQDSGKPGPGGVFGQIMDVVTKIAVCAIGAMGGPVGIAMAVIFCTKPEVFSTMNNSIHDTLKGMFGNSEAAQVLGTIVATAVCAMVDIVVSSGNPMLAYSLIMQGNGSVLNHTLHDSGCNDQQAAIASAVINAVVQIAAAIVFTVATGGAGAETLAGAGGTAAAAGAEAGAATTEAAAAATEASAEIAESASVGVGLANSSATASSTASTAATSAEAADATSESAEAAETSTEAAETAETTSSTAKTANSTSRLAKLGNAIEKMSTMQKIGLGMTAFQLVSNSVQIVGDVVTINNDLMMANAAKIKGAAEAEIEVLQAILKQLEGVINNITTTAMSGTVQTIEVLSAFQGKKYDDANDVTTGIFA